MNYQDLYLFIKVVEKGSLVAASRFLNIPTSTLSRRLQTFETELGYKLIHRSAKTFGLTEAGQRLYQTLSSTLHQLETQVEDVNSELSSLSGDIKITAPVTFGHHFVKQWVMEFMRENPRITVEIFLSNENVDLARNSIDIAFRLGRVTLNNWISRPLFQTRIVACASVGFIEQYGMPERPSELAALPLVALKRLPVWRFHNDAGDSETISPRPQLRTDEIRFAVDAVLEGIGACCLPEYTVRDALQSGQLVELMPAWHCEDRPANMLYPHRENLPLKTRTFIDFVMNKVRQSEALTALRPAVDYLGNQPSEQPAEQTYEQPMGPRLSSHH
ncbi:LysR family transcriptional regulator [Oceanobacter mangrovi]|uniref:LysR family transcriptional regulator n=1 Tax=Oceanobacter mangrovi TaxID=2862510 RepID=UPI001C8DA975|nr:LysR family transcriptional regulator [Oceanobacter mangrovi]